MVRRVFLGVVILVSVLPIVWVALTSVGIQHDNTTMPPTWKLEISLENYIQIKAEQTHFWREAATSILLSVATTLMTVGIAFLASYSLVHTAFRAKPLVLNSFLILASLPVISYVMPLHMTMISIQLYDTFVGIMLAETALFAPLAAFILYGYISQLPVELEEAAWLDGAGLSTLLFRVVLPAAAPGIMATAVIVFVLSWNQFILPSVITSSQIKTIPVMMRDFFVLDRDFEWPKVAAVMMISLLPLGLFVAAAHRALEWFTLNVTALDD